MEPKAKINYIKITLTNPKVVPKDSLIVNPIRKSIVFIVRQFRSVFTVLLCKKVRKNAVPSRSRIIITIVYALYQAANMRDMKFT